MPDADHYVISEYVDDVSGFDSCCQHDIAVGVEVPQVYLDEDGDGELTTADAVDGGACRDVYLIMLLHFPHPTHLWAAEWYHNLSEEEPGWTAVYGAEGTWWQDLDEDDYESLKLDYSCEYTSGWDSVSE